MSKMHCNVIQDMIPLYAEDICSEETRHMVDAHVTECETCRVILSVAMNQTNIEGNLVVKSVEDHIAAEEQEQIKVYKTIRKQVMRKTIKRVVPTVIGIICVIMIGLTLWYMPVLNASYKASDIQLTKTENGIQVDSIVQHFEGAVDGNTYVLTGKFSLGDKMTMDISGQHYVYNKVLGENIEKVIYREKNGQEYILWEK